MRDILRMSQLPISLEKPVGEDEDSSLGDFVQDESGRVAVRHGLAGLRREDIDLALDSLPERDRKVIELRYGLKGERHARSRRSAATFGVTRERIRQIENNTLKKLESLPEAQALRNSM